MGISGFRRGLYLLVRGVRLAVGDILAHGSAFEPGLLQHHAVHAPQRTAPQFGNAVPVHGDLTPVHLVKAHEQVDERRLAASRRPHDGDALARHHIQVEILNERHRRNIGKVHMAGRHTAPAGRGGKGVRRIRAFGRLVDNGEQALGAGHSRLKLRQHARHLVEGLGVLVRIRQKAAQLAHRNGTSNGRDRADNTYRRVDDGIDKARARIRHRRIKHAFQARVVQLIADGVELCETAVLVAKGLYDALPGNHLVDKTRQTALRSALRLEKACCAPGNEARKSNGHRRHQNHDQRDDRIQHSHHHKRAQNGSHSRQKLCQALQKPLGYKIRIVDHSADDVAVRVAVDVLQRRAVQHAECFAAHIIGRPAGNLAGADIHYPLAGCGQQHRNSQQRQIVQYAAQVHLPRAEDVVDGAPCEHRPKQGKKHIQQRAGARCRKRRAVGPHVGEDAFNGSPFHAPTSSVTMPCERQISR